MAKVDIITEYTYFNNEKEVFKLNNLNLKSISNDYFKLYNDSEELFLTLFENGISITKNKDVKYIKTYKLNEKTTSTINVDGYQFTTLVHCSLFEKNNNTFKIIAKEYNQNEEFIADVVINIIGDK